MRPRSTNQGKDVMNGFTGRILRVNLTTGDIQVEHPPDEFYRRYLGGSAMGTAFLLTETSPGCDPLGPENVITFAVGPLAGVPISGQSRIALVAKSPLSGAIGDSQMGGSFPAALKLAGFDAVTVSGQSDTPRYLYIEDGSAQLLDAQSLWGLETAEVDQLLRERHSHARLQVAQCGPAGERLVRYAAVIGDRNRAAGRTGMGAVLGSKRLKAIAVSWRPQTRPSVADPDRLSPLQRGEARGVRTSASMLTLQRYGTATNVDRNSAEGALPSENWSAGSFASADRLGSNEMNRTLLLRNDTCHACAVRCKIAVENERRGIDPNYGGPEYQTIAALGSLCGISNLESVAYANQRCNAAGLDTLNTGASIAFAMDCFRHGIIGLEETDGIDLSFGNEEAMLATLEAIIARHGIGDILAEGIDRAAALWGEAARELAPTVKGGVMPAHMPQARRSLGLIYAVNPSGPDHQSSQHDQAIGPGASEEERRRMALLGIENELAETDLSYEKVRFAWETQKFYSALDATSVCQFVYGPSYQLYGPDHLIEAINAVTGWDMTLAELQEIGERKITMQRLYNAREGLDRRDDRLPRKLYKTLVKKRKGDNQLSEQEISRATDWYHELAGWDVETGTPAPATLERLSIDADLGERMAGER